MVPNCRRCDTILILGNNWTLGRKAHHDNICRKCASDKNSAYYTKHKDHIKSLTKIWKAKNPEYFKEWDRKHRNKGGKGYPKRLEDGRKLRGRKRKEILELLGGKCFFCGSQEDLIAHAKSFKRHTLSVWWLLHHLDEVVLMCKKHHYYAHICHEFLGLSWEDLANLFAQFKKSIALTSRI